MTYFDFTASVARQESLTQQIQSGEALAFACHRLVTVHYMLGEMTKGQDEALEWLASALREAKGFQARTAMSGMYEDLGVGRNLRAARQYATEQFNPTQES